jgi:hypothetical protein
MQTSRSNAAGFWQRLLYRWFVEYNPLYLLSAALVLGGCFLWSRGLVHEESLAGPLGIAFVAELYAASLVGGAALLTRIGHRRPAVMLAMVFVVYQWDSTLHTETCAYLGWVGALATAAWLLVFIGKLWALGWALRVRFARHVVTAALVGAAGLALGPRLLPVLGGRGAGALLAAWVFALGALYRPAGIASLVELDDWGTTVLRRATRAAWLMSGGLLGLHVLMWWKDHNLPLSAAMLAVPLLAVPRIRSEARTWGAVVGILVLAAVVQPGAFFITSLLAGAALCIRALAPTFSPSEHEQPEAGGRRVVPSDVPYRASEGPAWAPRPSFIAGTHAGVGADERTRLLVGALFATYLAVWTLRWSSGPWPAHMVGLDVALTLAVLGWLWRTRGRLALLPLAACYGHLVVQARLLPIPTSSVGWGETIVGFGFALLAASLLTSYRLRAFDPRSADGLRGHPPGG